VETGFKREVAIPPFTLRVRNARRGGKDNEPTCRKYDGRAMAGPGLLTDVCVCAYAEAEEGVAESSGVGINAFGPGKPASGP